MGSSISSFEVCHHELKVSMVCVFFSNHLHFEVGTGRKVKLVKQLLIKDMKQEKVKESEELP